MPTDRDAGDTTPPAPQETTRRLFFALWPSERIATQLFAAATRLARTSGGRVMRAESLHLTLNFLGNVPERELPWICRAAAGVRAPAFRFALNTLGYWRHNRIVWAGCSAPVPAVADLATALAAALRNDGQTDGRAAFTPHLTLLRKAAAPADLDLGRPLHWEVHEFLLVESLLTGKGARYEIIGRWPLV